MTGPNDFLRVGDWNVRCDRCGKKIKGSEARLTWQGYYTCARCWEPRQPQDFVRSIQENPTPPFVRNPPDIIIPIHEGILMEGPTALWDDFDYIEMEIGGYILTEI